ncbi:hypothetical protein QJS83_06710 [Bdellovibrio sp. 22V]|uniref:hypothetical protein n=1 Tax=Bdellovibrio sp. 22V TaxID=3044166 RepID=UPI0025433BAE|nr:hypothetical protein [Bdellovibrio sp. 22V]WII73562.1 hypothetical protein QJS83_06710 [Bdellovibrio sp. 22V]
MKTALNVLVLVSIFAGSIAYAGFEGRIFDENGREVRTGERVVGVICDYFDDKRNPLITENPDLLVKHFQNNLQNVEKIMAYYQGEKMNQPIILHAPFELAPLSEITKYTRKQSATVPEKAVGAVVGVITLGGGSGSYTRTVTTYKMCVSVVGTYDARTTWEKVKEYFRR